MRRVLFAFLVPAIIGCGGSGKEPLCTDNPECTGEAVVAYGGSHQLVISELQIGESQDGFDLDHDGNPDNKMSAVGTIAGPSIEDAFDQFDIVIPMELFDLPTLGADECVKFSVYLGDYRLDTDQDGQETARSGGDCNDGDAAINPGAAEVPDNGIDDNCNGLADEAGDGTPSTNTDDADTDGVTIADGDCDDTDNSITGVAEVCGDGKDNDCDGAADFGDLGGGVPACTPYDDTPDSIVLDPLSFDAGGAPVIVFDDGKIDATNKLTAGPSIFSVNVPITDGVNVELRITCAQIEANLEMTANGIRMTDARLGGVLDAKTLDLIRGLEVDQIGLRPEDSLLDAVFANALGLIIGLKKNDEGCLMPDIDVDQDGLEAFCDSMPLDEIQTVDVCIDGDGTRYTDTVEGGVTVHCTEMLNTDGTARFADGVSVALTFQTVPAILSE